MVVVVDDPQNLHHSMPMDKPCEICGDIGYIGLIIVCSQCKITREHPYCMRLMHAGDPEMWICEDCQPVKLPLAKPGMNEEYESARKPLSRPGPRPEEAKVRFKISKPPQNSKVQYISPEEAMVLESGALKTSYSPRKSYLPPRSQMNKGSVSRREPMQPKTSPPTFKVIPNPHACPPGFRTPPDSRKRPGTSGDQITSSFKDKSKPVHHNQHAGKSLPEGIKLSSKAIRTANIPPEKETGKNPTAKRVSFVDLPKLGSEGDGKKSGSPQLVQPLPARSAGIDACTGARPKNVMPEGTEISKLSIELDNYLPNQPAESPTWKGSFRFTGDVVVLNGFSDIIQAHPPSKVSRKTYELSKKMPKAIQFEPLPRLNLWVDMFEDDVPSGLDIGLYFFPSKREGGSYARLVEYLGRYDVLLRSQMNGVELLIFSSQYLQENSQKIEKEYFLWGLFRPSGQLQMDLEGPPLEEPEAEDMEIDMMGGEDLCNSDVVVPKPCEQAFVGVTAPKEGEVAAQTPMNDIIGKFPPSKVKTESFSGIEASLPCVTDVLEEFERELQMSFDRFAEMMKMASGNAAAAPPVKLEDQTCM